MILNSKDLLDPLSNRFITLYPYLTAFSLAYFYEEY